MKTGIGLFLITLGAILRYAIDDDWDAVDLGVVGLILMLVGLAAFATGVTIEMWKRPRGPVQAQAPQQPFPPHQPPASQPPPQSPPQHKP